MFYLVHCFDRFYINLFVDLLFFSNILYELVSNKRIFIHVIDMLFVMRTAVFDTIYGNLWNLYIQLMCPLERY